MNPSEFLINLLPNGLSISQVVLESFPKGSNPPAMITNKEIVDFFAICLTEAVKSVLGKKLAELSVHQRQIHDYLTRLGKSGAFDLNNYISMVYEHFRIDVPREYINHSKGQVIFRSASPAVPLNDRPKEFEQKDIYKEPILRKPKPNRRGTDRRGVSSRVMPKKGHSIKTTIAPVIARKAENSKADKINNRARRFK